MQLIQAGRLQDALNTLDAIESQCGQVQNIYYIRSKILLLTNNNDYVEVAKEYLKQELSLFPDNTAAVELLNSL